MLTRGAGLCARRRTTEAPAGRSSTWTSSTATFDHVFSRDTPRDPTTWPSQQPRPVPAWTADPELIGKSLSGLGKATGPALITKAREMGVTLPPELDQPNAELTPELIVRSLRDIAGHFFPRLAAAGLD